MKLPNIALYMIVITSTQIVLKRLDVRINAREREKYGMNKLKPGAVPTIFTCKHTTTLISFVLFSFYGFDSLFIQLQITLSFFPGVLL